MSARIPVTDSGAREPLGAPLGDVSASELSASSTLDTLDASADEQALDKLMGRYEQLSARFDAFADAARGDDRREDEAGAGARRRDRSSDTGDDAPKSSRPQKRARRGRGPRGKAETDFKGFEGSSPKA